MNTPDASLTEETFEKYIDAAIRAIHLNIPFAFVVPPNREDTKFFATALDPDEGDIDNTFDFDRTKGRPAFFVTPYGNKFGDSYAIYSDLSADDILALPANEPRRPAAFSRPDGPSTPYGVYYSQVREILKAIRAGRVDKVVLSRLINVAGKTTPKDLISDMFLYCGGNPTCFCAIYFTQETGLWLTTSPEPILLVNVDGDNTTLTTRAVAGTRRVVDYQPEADKEALRNISADEPWDDKNVREHNMVLDFIVETLRRHNVETTVGEVFETEQGYNRHLTHEIQGKGNIYGHIFDILDDLNPTPALAGLPVKKAMKLISKLELHRRRLYGGVLGVISPGRLEAYVNIRCAQIEWEDLDNRPDMICSIYAGGGIVEGSTPVDEWVEAAGKGHQFYNECNSNDLSREIYGIPDGWKSISPDI